MKVIQTALPGALVLEPQVFGDERGFFYESYHQARYRDVGLTGDFIQTNVSRSAKGVLRGLHYQWPNPQGKLVSVLEGEVYDVAVDHLSVHRVVRPGS
jgi:dTDP-4-dehydrorhamnose 3,5-epimerase